MPTTRFVLEQLSSARGESDNAANIALAEALAAHPDRATIGELVEHLSDKSRRIQSDSVKTLYEIGERNPKLIAPYADEFAALLTNKNPRLIWGAMCALDAIAETAADSVFNHIHAIVEAAEGDSVIARDHAVNILATMSAAGHAKKCFPILLDIFERAPVNQVPAYAERAEEAARGNDRTVLARAISKHLATIEQPAKRKRLEKVLRKLASA